MALGKLPEDEVAGEGAIFSDINITPLTDIFLVLLIIFMVSSSVMVETATRAGVKVELPKGAAREIDPGAKSLVISVKPQGEILVQGQVVRPEDLDKLFESTVAKDPGTQVVIEGDASVAHGTIVQIMTSAKSAGLGKLGIATQGGQ